MTLEITLTPATSYEPFFVIYCDYNFVKSLFQTTYCPVAFFNCTLFRLTSISSDCLYPQQNAALIRSELVLIPENSSCPPSGVDGQGSTA